jgi:hypothetical protein
MSLGSGIRDAGSGKNLSRILDPEANLRHLHVLCLAPDVEVGVDEHH